MLTADALAPFRVRPEEVQRLRDKGAAHAHYRLGASGLLLRVPRLSQWSLAPLENLEYQAACFRRAEPSGATPRLAAVLPPAPSLPSGALAVEEIVGRPPRLPGDMAAIAAALAALHRVPVPPPAQRAPLRNHAPDPIAATAAMVVAQRSALASHFLSPETRNLLARELDWAADLAPRASAVTLVGTDTHPGNFIIRPDGCAVLVDLEKALYGSPAIDLAHASLPTSTLWDMDVAAELSGAETGAFYEAYADSGGIPMEPGLIRIARRLTALRTLMWCIRWASGALRSAELDPSLAAHLQGRVELLLDSRFVLDLFRSLTHG